MKQRYKFYLYLIVLNMLVPFASQACLPVVNWGSSISFCQGNSITLNAANPNSSYVWSTGANSSSITVNSSGTYWVAVTNQCGTTTDTIQVIVDSPVNVNLGADRAICANSSIKLSVPQNASSFYRWSNGSGSHQITVTQPGTYWAEVTNACGTYSDTVVISMDQPQQVNLGPDILNCSANSAVVKVQQPVLGSIVWSNGQQGDSITVTSSGTYWASVSNACGTFSDTVEVNFFTNGDLFSGDTLMYCPGQPYTLTSPIAAGNKLWNDGSTSNSYIVTQPGTYWLQVVLPCGVFSDTVHFISNVAPVVNLGPDLKLCPGQSITLDANNPGASYLWNNSSSQQTLTVTASGKYWVGVNTGCGYVYDTVRVTYINLPAPNIDDTVYTCQGSSPVVNAGSWGPNTSYYWSNGLQSRVNSTLTPGPQWVKVWNGCDTVQEDFFIKGQEPLNVFIGNDTTFCGTSMYIYTHLGHHGNTFLWSNGSSLPQLRVTKTGTYWVSVTNACGTYTDTINVTINKYPTGIAQTTIKKCVTDGVWLRTAHLSNATYQWSNGGNANNTYVTSPGKYWVTVSNVCDTISDTVWVEDVHPINFDLGADTAFCRPATLTLDLSSLPADSVVWSTGNRTDILQISNSGTYWVKVYNLCGFTSDTINVVVNERVVPVLSDKSFCVGSSVSLNASQPHATSYLWSNNSTSASISVSSPGWYFVDITGICGTIRDSAYVTQDAFLPQIDLGSDTIYCSGVLNLNPGNFPNSTYLWSNGSSAPTLNVNKTGTYYVSVSNSCNTVSDTINVLVTGPPVPALGNVVKFCAGSIFTLNAQNPGSTYSWSTGATSQTIDVTTQGKYWVTITNNCGVLTDTVELIVESPLDNISAGPDTIFCKGDSVLLGSNLMGERKLWSSGSVADSIFVSQAGTYWVRVSNSCGVWYDSVKVEMIDSPIFSLGNDMTICEFEGEAILYGPSGMNSYVWSNGSTQPTLKINSSGTYWLTVSNECFSYTDTIVVYPEYPIEIDLGPDTTLCAGQTLILNPPVGKGKVQWNNQPGSSYQEITESGTYWVVAQNGCGIFSDTINVYFDEYLNLDTEDTTVCDGDTATFDLRNFPHDFEWFDGSKDKVRRFTREGTYPIVIKNQCGEFTKNYRVNISYCECPFFIPNAFTPNYDNKNDEFRVGHSCDLYNYSIQIFNRWGEMVYESQDVDAGWNGNAPGGQALPMGVYTYRINYDWSVYGIDKHKEHTGTLTLIR